MIKIDLISYVLQFIKHSSYFYRRRKVLPIMWSRIVQLVLHLEKNMFIITLMLAFFLKLVGIIARWLHTVHVTYKLQCTQKIPRDFFFSQKHLKKYQNILIFFDLMLCAIYYSIANLVVCLLKRIKVIIWGTIEKFKNLHSIKWWEKK